MRTERGRAKSGQEAVGSKQQATKSTKQKAGCREQRAWGKATEDYKTETRWKYAASSKEKRDYGQLDYRLRDNGPQTRSKEQRDNGLPVVNPRTLVTGQ